MAGMAGTSSRLFGKKIDNKEERVLIESRHEKKRVNSSQEKTGG